MLKGKTHDTNSTTLNRVVFFVMSFSMFISAGISIIGAISINSLFGYFFFGGLGGIFLFIGYKLFQQIKCQGNYESYGIDLDKGVFWRAKMYANKTSPLETLEIPFSQVTTILLAPYEISKQVQRSDVYYHYYYDVPYILIVYNIDQKKHLLVITFKTNTDANKWLQASIETGCSVEVTDELVNLVLISPHPVELIENGIFKKELHFNGNVNNYIQADERDYRRHQYFPTQTEETVDFSQFVTFPLKAWQAFASIIVLFYSIFFIEKYIFKSPKQNAILFHTNIGMILGFALVFLGIVLFGYALKRGFSYAYVIYIFAVLMMLSTVSNPTLSEDALGYMDVFIVGSIPFFIVLYFLRKKKPAHHHFTVVEKKKRMRYKDQLEKKTSI